MSTHADSASVEHSAFNLFTGVIDKWNLDEEYITITIANEMTGWSRRTLSRHPSNCRWKEFGGTRCGYSGSETVCDRSYARCTELSNTDNYGGFRFVADIEFKEVWWGKNPK